jgi:hypothetical protein
MKEKQNITKEIAKNYIKNHHTKYKDILIRNKK